MSKRINCDCLTAELCFTYRTVNYVVVRTCVFTSSIYIVFNNNATCIMSKRINCDCLTAELCITYWTVNYIVVRTCVFTSSIYVVFNNNCAFRMVKLFNRNCFTTDFFTTLWTFNYAIVRTCCCTSCIDNIFSYRFCMSMVYAKLCTTFFTVTYVVLVFILMSECINCLLSNKNFATYWTMLTFYKTCCRTSRFYCCINHFGMTESCLFNVSCIITSWTSYVSIPTDFGTCRSFCFVRNLIVSKSINFCATSTYALVRTCLTYVLVYVRICEPVTNQFLPILSQSFNDINLLCFAFVNNQILWLIPKRTANFFPFIPSVFRIIGIHSTENNIFKRIRNIYWVNTVTVCICKIEPSVFTARPNVDSKTSIIGKPICYGSKVDCLKLVCFRGSYKNFVTYWTLSSCCLTYCSISRIYSGDSFFCMSCFGNYCLFNKNFITLRTVWAFCKTCSQASGSNCFINYYLVLALCITYVTANITICIVLIIVSMRSYRNYVLCYCSTITSWTMWTFSKTGFRTSSIFALIDYYIVSKLSSQFFMTYSTFLCSCTRCFCTGSMLNERYRKRCAFKSKYVCTLTFGSKYYVATIFFRGESFTVDSQAIQQTGPRTVNNNLELILCICIKIYTYVRYVSAFLRRNKLICACIPIIEATCERVIVFLRKSKCSVFVSCKWECYFNTTGNEHLFSLILNKSCYLTGYIFFGQIPTHLAIKINWFYKYIAVLSKLNCKLTVHELIFAKIFPITIATIVSTVDVSNEIIIYVRRILISTNGANTGNESMSKLFNCFLALCMVTSFTILVSGVTFFCTSSILALYVNKWVIESCVKCFATYCTGLCCCTRCFCTCCMSKRCTTCKRCSFFGLVNVTTSTRLVVNCRFRTSCCRFQSFCFCYFLSVNVSVQLRNYDGLKLILFTIKIFLTFRTLIMSKCSCCFSSCINFFNPFAVLVTCCRNDFLFSCSSVTSWAVRTCCKTCFCTSGSFCFICYHIVAESFTLCMSTIFSLTC